MGVVTNVRKSLEERIQELTRVARNNNIDFDISFIAARGEWTSNWGEGYVRSNLVDLLELLEEDIRNPLPTPPVLPEEPEPVNWKL